MPQEPPEPDERGFVFTEADFARRYGGGEGAADPAAPRPAPAAGRAHGGGNSFMRARRRRLAASASPSQSGPASPIRLF